MEDDARGGPPPEGGQPPEVTPAPVTTEADVPAPPVEVVSQAGLIRRPPPPPPPPPPLSPEEREEEGMLRMSFMEHLEELRNRIIKALYGLAAAFVFSLVFAGK